MFAKITRTMEVLINNTTILIIIAVALFTLLIDGKRYKSKGYIREFKIIRLISYSYIAIGGLMYVLLLLM